MHQPDSPSRDPVWMQQRPAGPAANGRYGTRNLREAYTLLSSPESAADLEPERLGRKLLLALPLAGRGNGLPLLLEPSGSLAAVLVGRGIFGVGPREPPIPSPPRVVAFDTHAPTCFSP